MQGLHIPIKRGLRVRFLSSSRNKILTHLIKGLLINLEGTEKVDLPQKM